MLSQQNDEIILCLSWCDPHANVKLPIVILRVNFLTLPPFLALAEQKIAAKCYAETVTFLATKPDFQDSSGNNFVSTTLPSVCARLQGAS